MPRPTWPVKKSFSTDEDNEKSLEQRVNQLTAQMENMQKIMDRFISLYESERVQNLSHEKRQENDAMDSDDDSRHYSEEKTKVALQKSMRKQEARIHAQERKQWQKEREQLQKELKYYKSLAKKCLTSDSATQTISTGDCKCTCCKKSYKNANDLKRHQNVECKQTQTNFNCICIVCQTIFSENANSEKNIQAKHGLSTEEVNEPLLDLEITHKGAVDSNVHKVIKRQTERYFAAKRESMLLMKMEMDKQEKKAQQVIHETLKNNGAIKKSHNKAQLIQIHDDATKTLNYPAWNNGFNRDDNKKVPKSVSSVELTFKERLRLSKIEEKSLQANVPTTEQTRQKYRDEFMSVLKSHRCSDSCSIVTLKKYIKHAANCDSGSGCYWYICKQQHLRLLHRRYCKNKVNCSSCQAYLYFNENTLQETISYLQLGCPLKLKNFRALFTTDDVVNVVARLIVEYGLIRDNKIITGVIIEESTDSPICESEVSSEVESESAMMIEPSNDGKLKGVTKRLARFLRQTEEKLKHPTTDEKTRMRIKNKFLSLINNAEHTCNKDSECPINVFKNVFKHAEECTDGLECKFYICKRQHTMLEHFKACDDKFKCASCQIHLKFNESNMLQLVKLLRKGCPENKEDVQKYTSINNNEHLIMLISRYVVDYRLVGNIINEKKVVDKEVKTKKCYTRLSNSFSSEEASEWEFIEPQLRILEDKLKEDERRSSQ